MIASKAGDVYPFDKPDDRVPIERANDARTCDMACGLVAVDAMYTTDALGTLKLSSPSSDTVVTVGSCGEHESSLFLRIAPAYVFTGEARVQPRAYAQTFLLKTCLHPLFINISHYHLKIHFKFEKILTFFQIHSKVVQHFLNTFVCIKN